MLFFGTMIGADIRYIRSRNPRVIFEALREHGVTTMVGVPQLLELFWNGHQARGRAAGQGEDLRPSPGASLVTSPTGHDGSCSVGPHPAGRWPAAVRFGGRVPSARAAAAWEDLGVVVVQGYGATECGPAQRHASSDHPTGTVGRTVPPVQLKLDPSDERDPRRRPDRLRRLLEGSRGHGRRHDATAGTAPATSGGSTSAATSSSPAAPRTSSCCRTASTCFRRTSRTSLEEVGLRQAVVLETAPGRIEAVVLSPDAPPIVTPNQPRARRASKRRGGSRARNADRAARSRPRTRKLSQHQRIDDFRIWPESDFPRTHTLKIKRSEVQKWAAADVPLALARTSD